jgi:hypothetical protein
MDDFSTDSNTWPFEDPAETEVITLDRILDGRSSILLVTHDADEESSWQFLDGEQVFEDNGVTVLLGEIVQFDPSLLDLADLPCGWHARRDSADQPWTRAEGEPS